ncbi:MAG TPA: ABC transporter permease [Candidatus Margulisiibacteriota bacterium]|nr:ABC transporter permease [Candidatus Margulisiibacteriota bacterium]
MPRLVSGWSAAVILALEFGFFALLLAPHGTGPHTFANAANVALILKYSSIYGIGAIGAAMIIGAGGIDLAPGAVIALASVLTGHLFIIEGWPLWAACSVGLGVGFITGGLAALLIIGAHLPPFIATLGVMGIARGAAFLITEGRFYDLSQRLPAGTAPLGIPLAAWPGVVMLAFAAVFQFIMVRTATGRHILATGGNEVAARYAGVHVGRVQAFVYITGGVLAALSGVVLAVVQGQGKADLATGYELDIIAAAVVGGASLAGGRASVAGAVIGSLIFGVLRNALAQIPGGTFADRLILGVAVLVIVVMDRLATREER